MKDPTYGSEEPGKNPEPRLSYILPQFVSAMGFSCAREWTEKRTGLECGCPRCLNVHGLTLIFFQEDWRENGDCQEQWRVRIVSQKTSTYVKHLICPGYDPR